MKYLYQLLLWSSLGTAIEWVYAQNAERFVDEILQEYRTVDQAGRADTSMDGVITDQEFAYSLYQNADFEGNNDNGVTVNEFVDHYVKHYNISSELAIFMFDLLNDPGNHDNKITSNDITLRSFLGRDFASSNEYRDALQKWVTQAAKRLYNVLTNPHIIDRTNDLSPRYDILSNIDTDGDGFISYQELKEEFGKLSSNQNGGVQINRDSWIEHNVHTYGADPVTSILTFDYWDRDGDLIIAPSDLRVAILDLDKNGDGRISRQEYLQYFERGCKLSRRISGKSIQLPKRACSAAWWSKLRASPTIDAVRAVMDFDDDFDGWISLENVRRWLKLFDTNADGFLNLDEYVSQHTTRYGVNATIASSMFDLVDLTGDNRVGDDDWLSYFKDGIEISFCDAKRSVLDLARMAEKFHDIPQASAKRTSMNSRLKEEWNWFLQNEQAPDWMGLGPYNQPQTNLCHGQVACYEGEQTLAWGLHGASLWWIQDLTFGWSSNMDNMAQMTGGPLLTGVLPAVLMGGPVPLKRATDSPSSNSKRPVQNTRQINSGGMAASSQPNGNGFQFIGGGFPGQFPNMNNNKGQMTNPLMKQYQRLFNQQPSFGPSGSHEGNSGVTSPMKSSNTNEGVRPGANFPFRSQLFTEKQTTNFSPVRNEQDGFRLMNQGQNTKPTAQPWPSSKTMNVNVTPRSMTNFPMQNQLSQNPQMPFIGLSAYPLVLNIDPSASLLWRTMTRRRKATFQETKSSTEETANERRKRDEDSIEENKDQNTKANETDSNINKEHWDSMIPGFGPSPFDIWMSWSLERLMWENGQSDVNITDVNDETSEGLQGLENTWNEMESPSGEDNLNDEEAQGNNSDGQEKSTDSRQKRNTGEDRHKRWALYVQRLRRNPYLYAMRKLWLKYYCFPPFDFLNWRHRVGSPQFWYPCYMYNNNMFPWWLGMTNPLHSVRWSRNLFGTRVRRSTSESDAVGEDVDLKRAFSFDNWFKNKQNTAKPLKQGGNMYISQTPSSTNSWKAVESSKYGMKNNWGQRLEEESSEWTASSKERFGFDNNHKWKTNQRPSDGYRSQYNIHSTFPPMNGRMPSFSNQQNARQWDTGRFAVPQIDMQWTDSYYGSPSNVAAFLMPSLVSMAWNKRKINDDSEQRFPDRMTNKYKPPANGFSPMSSHLHQTGNQFPNSLRGAPWVNDQDFYDMYNPGSFMWNKRFVRSDIDTTSEEKGKSKTPIVNKNSRKRRSSKDVEKYAIGGLKEFLVKNKNKYKTSRRVASWLPWQSWKMLRNKKQVSRTNKNSVVTKMQKSFSSTNRQKRGTLHENEERNKRWGFNNPMWYGNGWNWNQWMSHQWNPWTNNYMRFSRESDDTADNVQDIGREKRNAEEDKREKRFGLWNRFSPWYGQGNWNGMFNRWSPWYNWGRWNYMRYPRGSTAGEDTDTAEIRQKRDTEEGDRSKRWGFNNPMWYGNAWNWNQWMSNQWNAWTNNYMRFSRESDDTADNVQDIGREKRNAEETDKREKRFGMWNRFSPWYGQGNWNGMSNRWSPWYNWGRWNYMRYPRGSDATETDEAKESRQKRDAEEGDRSKRWGFNNPMWYGNGWNWNQWMSHQWNPWTNNYMRFSRESDDTADNVQDIGREKRNAEEDKREKRFGMWNRFSPWYRQGSWNGMFNRWSPWYNWGRWNYMRYPRGSDATESDEAKESRQKRDAEEGDRSKRWGFNNPMWYGNGWNWNQWMSHQWNPWTNNYMRFSRESDDTADNVQDIGREKRNAEETDKREKRFGMWNRFSPWYRQGNWNGMFNRWSPWYNWGRWNYMRYPRDSAVGEDKDTAESRQKRDAEEGDRSKRWGFNNPMWYGNGWNWNQWMSHQWNAWTNNYMRFSRESDDTADNVQDIGREKRNAEETDKREKRFGMWNRFSPWYRQGNWNGMSNRWSPWYNWGRWNYMRYPRGSDATESDEAKESRQKRDAEEGDRSKRWGFNNPMWYGNGWNWDQWMSHQWNAWSNNYMRFSRESDDTADNVQDIGREKRNAEEDKREKRFGMWNRFSPWYGQGNWNGMSNRWSPWYNWGRWNYMRYPRGSAVGEDKDTAESRQKRDAEEGDRSKRWGFNNPMWYGNGWNWDQWMSHQWNAWTNNYMRFSRESDDTADNVQDIERGKRSTEEDKREKRFGMWNRFSPWYGQGNWNGMSNRWSPWYNWGRWNYMRYPRGSDATESDEVKESRQKRDAEEGDRSKRWGFNNPMWYGNGWNWDQWMSHQWNPWTNNYMRFSRESDDTADNVQDIGREKRNAEEDKREKRFGMWNRFSPWYRQGNWNGMFNRWSPWYNWGRWNYMRYPRDSTVGEDTDTAESRQKRDAEEGDRSKRWGFNNPMWYGNGWNWNQWMSHQWNPWSNNYMRFSRESDDTADNVQDIERGKRSAEEADKREKRFGLWNRFSPWYRQGNWNGMFNRWSPWYNWGRWNYMRYPRGSDATESDEAKESRQKRDAEEGDRSKRWGFNNPMWYGNGWNWDQWMSQQWNPWTNNYMRFSRESDKTERKNEKRNKRDTSQVVNRNPPNFEKRPMNWMKEPVPVSKMNNIRGGIDGNNMMKTMLQHNQKAQHDGVTNEWGHHSTSLNQRGPDAWNTKWRRWMDNSKRSDGFPWFWPRFPWMGHWENPMMSNSHPWFYNRGWW